LRRQGVKAVYSTVDRDKASSATRRFKLMSIDFANRHYAGIQLFTQSELWWMTEMQTFCFWSL